MILYLQNIKLVDLLLRKIFSSVKDDLGLKDTAGEAICSTPY
jgi:hypothetical protein